MILFLFFNTLNLNPTWVSFGVVFQGFVPLWMAFVGRRQLHLHSWARDSTQWQCTWARSHRFAPCPRSPPLMVVWKWKLRRHNNSVSNEQLECIAFKSQWSLKMEFHMSLKAALKIENLVDIIQAAQLNDLNPHFTPCYTLVCWNGDTRGLRGHNKTGNVLKSADYHCQCA